MQKGEINMDRIKQNLLELIALPGPSGYEDQVADYITTQMEVLNYQVERDGMGNITAAKKGGSDLPLLLVTAHMDEVGLVVTKIVNGFICFNYVGTINMRIAYGLPFKILTESGPVPAVACSPSVHLDQDFAEVWLDAGPRTALVQPGDPIVFDTEPRWLDDDETVIAGKSMDDRVGCAILLELARILDDKKLSMNLVLGFTVQEEISARGAEYLGRRFQPDYAIVLDTGLADDLVAGVAQGQPPLGTGPLIRTFEALNQDRGGFVNFADRAMVKALKAASDSVGAKYHVEASLNLYTDASGIRKSSPHTRSVYVGVPRRYSHSPYEVLDITAVSRTVDVLAAYFRENWFA